MCPYYVLESSFNNELSSVIVALCSEYKVTEVLLGMFKLCEVGLEKKGGTSDEMSPVYRLLFGILFYH